MLNSTLPPELVRELEFIGVLKRMPEYTKRDGFNRSFKDLPYNKPVLDEYGEPPF
jgi:hypothetical protein